MSVVIVVRQLVLEDNSPWVSHISTCVESRGLSSGVHVGQTALGKKYCLLEKRAGFLTALEDRDEQH